MFTDMVGYTALGQRNENLSIALVEEQRKTIRPILKRHGGREVNTMGDAFLVEFPNAIDAVRCAYDIQRAVREFNVALPSESRIHLRIGMHLGEVIESGGDISGDAVNVASRVEPLAEIDGVCITRQVYDHVQNKFELKMESLGVKPMKNVSVTIEVFKIVMPWDQVRPVTSERPDKRRIAILPFSNLSPDPNDEYFADGMTEELISTMSKIGGLKVIARTSVMGYKGSSKKVDEISKELGVGTILEGSVRKASQKLRITVQLIDSQNSDHLWAESYDRELKDVFEIQSDISKAVAQELRVVLLPAESKEIEKALTKSPSAYELYLRGREYYYLGYKELKEAIRCYERAIELDPDFAAAYAALAYVYHPMSDPGQTLGLKYDEKVARARSLITKALEIDNTLSEAYMALGDNEWTINRTREGWLAEEAAIKHAIELKPNFAAAHWSYSNHLLQQGDLKEALEEIRTTIGLDPRSTLTRWYLNSLGFTLVYAGQYDAALEQFEKLLSDYPDVAYVAHRNIGRVYLAQSRFDDALREFQLAVDLGRSEDRQYALSYVGVAYAKLGRKEDAEKIVAELRKMSDDTGCEILTFLSYIRLAQGDAEESIRLLEEANERNETDPFIYLKGNPLLREIQTEPRFVNLLRRIGLVADGN